MWNKIISRKNIRRFLRYAIMFLTVFIASQYIPECKISYATAFIMATVAVVTFAIIDMYYPLLT